jgi:transposase
MANEMIGVRRRRYGEEIKLQILAQCEAPGASVAKVAMAHGINANIVHSWRKRLRASAAHSLRMQAGIVSEPREQQCTQSGAAPAFVPLAIEAAAPALPQCIDIELRRGPMSMTLSWPLSAAAELTNFARALLR